LKEEERRLHFDFYNDCFSQFLAINLMGFFERKMILEKIFNSKIFFVT